MNRGGKERSDSITRVPFDFHTVALESDDESIQDEADVIAAEEETLWN